MSLEDLSLEHFIITWLLKKTPPVIGSDGYILRK